MNLNDNPKQIELQLIKYLNILYGGQAEREEFNEANRFLIEFGKHCIAWNVCLGILCEMNNNDNILILRFSSQTIYDNLLENWRTIDIPQRVEIVTRLQKFIQLFCDKYLLQYLSNNDNNSNIDESFRFILNKICQTIAFLALNAKQALNMIQSVFNSCSSIKLPQQLSLLWVNLEILNAFALEFEQQHVSMTIIQETRDFLTTKYKQTFLNIIMCSIKSSQQYQNTLYRLIEISFSSLKHWINIVDITLENMDSVGLLDEILNVIYLLYETTDYSQCKQFMVESMTKIITKGIIHRDNMNNYEKILNKISNTLVKLQPILQRAIESNHIDTIRSLCNLICSFCENEATYIAKGDNVNLDLVKMILQFTSHSSPIITTETFGFWSRLQDIGMNHRHKSLQKDVYIQLLRSLLLHSTDPQEFDQHSRFRSNSSEIFISIYFILQKQYFIEIEKELKRLFENLGNNNNNSNNLIFVRIESCIFALAMIAQEVYDERDEQYVQQSLNQHIKPICDALFASNLRKLEMNAISLHLLTQICDFFKGYSFYISNNTEILQKCLLYNIETATKYQPIMAYQCSKTFNSLLYRSVSIWIKQLNDFENIIKYVSEQIGDGQQFYDKLTSKQLELLQDHDPTISDPITRQQRAVSIYYESLCMVIDIYNDKNRQKLLINNLILPPITTCNSILKNISNNNTPLNISIFYQLLSNLRIFCGFIRGLNTTNTSNHPLIPHIENILNICVNSTKQISLLIQNNNNNDEQKNDNDNDNDIDINMLHNAVCDVMESVLDIFGSNTSNIIDGLVQISLEILKSTKSESSARILKKMVSTFSGQNNLENNFIKLIKEAIIYFNNDNIGDIRLFHSTISEIFECVEIMLKSYSNTSEIWTQLIPNSIALSLRILTKIEDRNGLRSALKLLALIFDPKNITPLNKVGNELKKSLLPSIITILFNGMTSHFERYVAIKVYDVYYNLMQFDPEYIKQQTILQLTKVKINAFQDDNNKKLFITAFWKQRSNQRKFNLVMSTFFSVCHNFNTPDSFGTMIE